MLRRGLHALRLGIIRMAIISRASGVWTLLSDDLSSVIFWTVYRTPSKVFDIPRLTGTDFEILWTLIEFILLMTGLTII